MTGRPDPAAQKRPSSQPDPRVGLNPTGRPRRSSAASRRKHARRQAVAR